MKFVKAQAKESQQQNASVIYHPLVWNHIYKLHLTSALVS